jgi:hypothetical protein
MLFKQKFTNKEISKEWVDNILGDNPQNHNYINKRSYKFTRHIK